MGCDFSILVRQKFSVDIFGLQEQCKDIEKRQKKIRRMTEDFSEITSPMMDIDDIANELVGQLTSLEILLQKAKLDKSSSSDDSFNISQSLNVSEVIEKLPPIHKKKLEITTVKKASVKSTEKSPVKLNNAESILEDPEIMALINKNRNKFLNKRK